jgi:hypothetical protein
MGAQENKKLFGRAELKKYFRNGQVPTETHFGYLIDSVIIKHDDGISKDEENGYIISPLASSKRLITFYGNMDRVEPYFYVEKDNQKSASLKFQSGKIEADRTGTDDNSFFLHQNGNLGIGKRADNKLKLDVNGFAGSEGRAGTYKADKVPANGVWHTIIPDLDNCHAFEIVARTGKRGSGKFSLMHAIALCTYGHSRSKIRKTNAYFGFFWNKLNLRWKMNSTHNYELQLRSNRNFGNDVDIYFNVTKLWDDELFLPEDYYHTKKTDK